MSIKLPRLSQEKRFEPYLFDSVVTFAFLYLLFDEMMVLRFNGPFSRIDLLGFLVPHASKVALWATVTLFVLKPRFGWRFPFSMFMLYCSSELLTNGIWIVVHGWWTFPDSRDFLLSCAFFILGIILSYLPLRGNYKLRFDWAFIPFAIWVGAWILQGYQTDSTVMNPSYWIETQEFVWNVLYLLMVSYIFKPKSVVAS